MEKRKRIFVAVLLVLSIANYARLSPTESFRPVEFLSVLVMGALAGILLVDIMRMIRK
jgi:hypothetical protein